MEKKQSVVFLRSAFENLAVAEMATEALETSFFETGRALGAFSTPKEMVTWLDGQGYLAHKYWYKKDNLVGARSAEKSALKAGDVESARLAHVVLILENRLRKIVWKENNAKRITLAPDLPAPEAPEAESAPDLPVPETAEAPEAESAPDLPVPETAEAPEAESAPDLPALPYLPAPEYAASYPLTEAEIAALEAPAPEAPETAETAETESLSDYSDESNDGEDLYAKGYAAGMEFAVREIADAMEMSEESLWRILQAAQNALAA